MSDVVSIGHDKGGVGKTSTAFNLAVELSKESDIVVIDLDNSRQITKINNHRKANGFTPLTIVNIENKNQLLEFLKSTKSNVIIDIGGYDSELSRAALLLSDLIITPLSSSGNDLGGLEEYMKLLRDILKSREDLKCGLLVNRVFPQDKRTQETLVNITKDDHNFFVFKSIMRNRKEFGDMYYSGQSISELTKGSASLDLQALIKEIKQIMEN